MAVAEVTTVAGYVIGKKAGAPDGSRVEVNLTGPVATVIRVAVDGRAALVDSFDVEPTATLTLSSNDWLALTGGRVDPAPLIADGRVGLGGDLELAGQLAGRLAFTI
jgi:putative sterol carrier protein